MEHFITSEIIKEILQDPPRSLHAIKAELLILDGTYILHYREDRADRYKCLSPSTLRAAFANESIDSGWISEGVVRWGIGATGEWAVKFIPPMQHTLDCDEMGKIYTPLPGMIFAGKGHNYWLWATNTPTFDPTTNLFYAPLPNIYATSGQVCWGQNQPPIATALSISEAWQLFISSPFNSHLCNAKSKRYPHDIRHQLLALHKKQAKSKACRYPLSDLLLLETITLSQLIERLADGYN